MNSFAAGGGANQIREIINGQIDYVGTETGEKIYTIPWVNGTPASINEFYIIPTGPNTISSSADYSLWEISYRPTSVTQITCDKGIITPGGGSVASSSTHYFSVIRVRNTT